MLLEAVSDESVVLGDIVDDRAKAGKIGGDDSFGREENQLHAGFLQLGNENLNQVLDKGDCELKSPGHVADDLVVPLGLALHVEVGLEGMQVVDKQLPPQGPPRPP